MASNTKNKKKDFYRYVNQKRKVKEGKLPTINSDGKLVTMEEEKTEVLKDFLPQSPMATSLSTSLELMDRRMGTEGTKLSPSHCKEKSGS